MSGDATGTTLDEISTDVEPSMDATLSCLNHPRRRYVLSALANGESEMTLTELSKRIGAVEGNKPMAKVSERERKEIHIALYHSHVPVLGEHELVEYRRDTDEVLATDDTDRVASLLERAREQ